MTTILVTLDGSDVSREVLPLATRLARDLGAKVTLLEVVHSVSGTLRGTPEPPTFSAAGAATAPATPPAVMSSRREPRWAENAGQAIERVESEARESLADTARALEAEGIDVVEKVMMSDDPAQEIVRFAKEQGFDFIAMATHGRSGLSEFVQGSVASAVVKSGVAPVLLVRPKGKKT